MKNEAEKRPARICLLTGPPGCGKTTLVRWLAESLEGVQVAGFLTAEIREAGRRLGFTATDFCGTSCVLAHRKIRSPLRVGAYGVDIEAFERMIIAPLESTPRPDMYVLDEIGKMELLSPGFRRLIQRLVAESCPILATIPVSPLPFFTQLKQREEALLVYMEHSDRAAAARTLVAWCRGHGFNIVSGAGRLSGFN